MIDPRIPKAYIDAGIDVSKPPGYELRIVERRQEDGSFVVVRMIEMKKGDVFRYHDTPDVLYEACTDGYWHPEFLGIGTVEGKVFSG